MGWLFHAVSVGPKSRFPLTNANLQRNFHTAIAGQCPASLALPLDSLPEVHPALLPWLGLDAIRGLVTLDLSSSHLTLCQTGCLL